MLNNRQLLLIFIPALLVVIFAFFIRFLQHEIIFPEETANEEPAASQIQIPIFPEDPIIGDKKSPITLIMFTDLACAGCQEQDTIFNDLINKYPGKIKIIWKGLPVTSLPTPSRWAHEYAFCAREQGRFNEFKEIAFANQESLLPETLQIIAKDIELDLAKLDSCLNSTRPDEHIKNTEDLALLLNIQSVPIYFLNNEQIKAPRTIEGWETLLQL